MNFNDCQLVAQIGSYTFTKLELEKLFSMVKPTPNWKEGIDAYVPLCEERDVVGMGLAIEYFTGGKAEIEQIDEEMHTVIAPGFYVSTMNEAPMKGYYEVKHRRE